MSPFADCPEKSLAVAIIAQCAKDVHRSLILDPDDFDFLTGRTEISRFWFQVAELRPFTERIVIDVFGGGL
jgi:hypothetical protein